MICSYLRGMEQFLMDLALDRALAERLIGEVGEFAWNSTGATWQRSGPGPSCTPRGTTSPGRMA